MSSSSPYPSTLPFVGPPLSSWSTAFTHRSGVRDRRQQKLGLWSAVALQQHFTTTGGRRGRPLPPTESLVSTHEGLAERAGASTTTTTTTTVSASYGEASTANGDGDLRAHLGPAGSLAAHPHKPTLAQRMGLVPPPPPAPSADDWRVVVHRAMQREHYASRETPAAAAIGPSSLGAVCSICQMSFLSTSNEGQVILSCSHIFHAQCFRAFEQCVRAQQRADGAAVAEVTTQLACPVCRTQHYYKRAFYEGKAMTQRAAVVKVQSAIRGFLARRGYVKIRLQHNVHFRTRYVQERLARLSAAWSAFCAQQAQHREKTLVALAVQHQAATAAYLSEEQWATVWESAVRKAVEPGTNKDAEDGGTGGSGSDSHGVVVMQCPICLERIYETFFSQRQRAGEDRDAAQTGEDAVASLRCAYEQRRTAKQSASATGPTQKSRGTCGDANNKKSAQRSKAASTTPPAPTSSSLKGQQQKNGTPDGKMPAYGKAVAASAVQLPPLSASTPLPGPAALFRGPQSGVLLSCGHCFHAACLGCFERYNEQHMTEAAGSKHSVGSGVVVADRCPICRAGYAKHPL